MTNEELERAMDFLLRSQANLDERIELTNQQLAQTNKQLGEFADTQAGIIQVMTRTLEAQERINEQVGRFIERQDRVNEAHERDHDSFRAAMNNLAAAQTRTEEAIARLAERLAGPPAPEPRAGGGGF